MQWYKQSSKQFYGLSCGYNKAEEKYIWDFKQCLTAFYKEELKLL